MAQQTLSFSGGLAGAAGVHGRADLVSRGNGVVMQETNIRMFAQKILFAAQMVCVTLALTTITLFN
jgi:hypothetical protein